MELTSKIETSHASIGSESQISPEFLGLTADDLIEIVGGSGFDEEVSRRAINVAVAFDPVGIANSMMSWLDSYGQINAEMG